MTDTLSKRRLKLWVRMLRVTRLAENHLRAYLRAEHDTTLPRFDVMAALYRNRDPVTMSELSRMLLVSNGNATAVVDRLELDGLAQRSPSTTDRRAVFVALTKAGAALFETLAANHETQIDQLFGNLTEAELDNVTEILRRMLPERAARGNA